MLSCVTSQRRGAQAISRARHTALLGALVAALAPGAFSTRVEPGPSCIDTYDDVGAAHPTSVAFHAISLAEEALVGEVQAIAYLGK